MDCANIAATIMEHLVDHNAHGYTQGGGRIGDGTTETMTIDGETYTFAGGDRDCSSAVIDCWRTALDHTDFAGALDAATYTGNMESVFVGSGLFTRHPMGDGYIAKRGDVYLFDDRPTNRGHTAMCISAVPDMLAEFSINEFGGIVGGQVGDQTGHEAKRGNYYDFPWSIILAYNGKADDMALTDEDCKRVADQVWRYILASEEGDADAGNFMREIRRNSRELTRTDDPTGRGSEHTMQFRLAFVGARLDEIEKRIGQIAAKVGA